jgi:hypothetical protein
MCHRIRQVVGRVEQRVKGSMRLMVLSDRQ